MSRELILLAPQGEQTAGITKTAARAGKLGQSYKAGAAWRGGDKTGRLGAWCVGPCEESVNMCRRATSGTQTEYTREETKAYLKTK